MPGTGAARRRILTDERKIKLEAALTHILGDQEMPMSDLNVLYNLRNVLDDVEANQK